MALRLSIFLAVKFILRQWRTTLILALMVIGATASLTFLSSLATGINDAMIDNSTGLYSGHISVNSSTVMEISSLLIVDGVKGLLTRKQQAGYLVTKSQSLPIQLISVVPSQEISHSTFWKKTTVGRFLKDGERAIYISRHMADSLQLDVSREVKFKIGISASEIKYRVCGIFTTNMDQFDSRMAFTTLKSTNNSVERYSYAVFLEKGVSSDKVADHYRSMNLPIEGVKTWQQQMPDLTELILLNRICMRIVIILIFAVVALAIACTFIIFILMNLREYGILKSMGYGAMNSTLLILLQVLFMTIISVIIGVFLGCLIAILLSRTGIDLSKFTAHNQYFSVSGIIFPRITLSALLWPPITAIIFGVLAAIWPARFLAQKKAAEILQTVS